MFWFDNEMNIQFCGADIKKIKKFLTRRGFQLKKKNYYFKTEVGLILEDLH